jgi:sugar lactone lactonase YvrE
MENKPAGVQFGSLVCYRENSSMINSSRLRTLLTGRIFGESARWHDGRFWFSDWGTGEIIAVDPDGRSEVVVHVPFTTFPFCFDWLPDGRLLIVSTSGQPLLRREPNGELVSHSDLSGLSSKGWNEIVVDGRGNAYINGVGFDLMAGEPYTPGMIALVTPDGAAREVAGNIAFPNGMAVTPDNATLIVAESYGKRLTAFDIAADGSLHNRRIWALLEDGVPDGISFDMENTLWYADVPSKRCVRVREGGEVLDTIHLDRGAFSCALGGEGRKTLFVVATQWRGPAKMFEEPRSGVVLMVEVGASLRDQA